MKTINVTAQVEVPRVPNFLLMSDGQKIPISAVTEEGLEEIGKDWTLALINRAREQRSGLKEKP